MKTLIVAGAAVVLAASGQAPDDRWTETFPVERAELSATGRNPWFVLEPGHQLVLEDGEDRLTITVLDETKLVDGVETRIVEEHETEDGEVTEISRNFFAISTRTNSVFYFGEEVDIYRNGKVVGHDGAWLSGADGARFGLMMPGEPLLGSRYYQEVAPGVAMDRAEVVSLTERVEVPAGVMTDCLRTEETTPLEPKEKSYKSYARGIGLVRDGAFKLVRHGPGRPPAR